MTNDVVSDLIHLSEKANSHENSKQHLFNQMRFTLLGKNNIKEQLDNAYWQNIAAHNEKLAKNWQQKIIAKLATGHIIRQGRGSYNKRISHMTQKQPRKNVVAPLELNQPIKCQYCSQSFHTNLSYAFHSINHNENNRYSCHLCGKYSTKSKHTLEVHVRSHEGSRKYKCEICNKTFKVGTHALEHKNFHTGDTPFQCEVCGKHFMFSWNLASHRRTSHYPDITGNPPVKYECTKCNVAYKFMSSLSRHNQNKHRKVEKSILCDICGKRLSCSEKFKYHLRNHTGLDTVQCLICDKKFSRKEQLVCHMRIHTGEKPFTCKYCGREFAQSAPYRYHIKAHTGVRPHICPQCGKGFIAKSTWRRHSNNCDGLPDQGEEELSES